jgi:hypothetical protein
VGGRSCSYCGQRATEAIRIIFTFSGDPIEADLLTALRDREKHDGYNLSCI